MCVMCGKTAAAVIGWPCFFFVLALLSKPMPVTLPVVMLLLDYWPLARFAGPKLKIADGQPTAFQLPFSVLWEKWPFCLMSAASCVITFLAQHDTAVSSLTADPMGIRLENALTAYAGYLWKMVWAARSGDILSAARTHPMAIIGGGGDPSGGHFGDRLAGAQMQSVADGWLAVVFGDFAAGHRPGAGRRAGDGRPLQLFFADWNFCGRRLFSAGRWPAVSVSLNHGWPRRALSRWARPCCSRKGSSATGMTANPSSPTPSRWRDRPDSTH